MLHFSVFYSSCMHHFTTHRGSDSSIFLPALIFFLKNNHGFFTGAEASPTCPWGSNTEPATHPGVAG